MKLNGHEYAQAHIEIWDGNPFLVSYTTIVCGIEYHNGEPFIWCNGLYSRTTIRHIGWFAREYGMTYQDFKRAYESSAIYNPFTGEIFEN